VRRVAEQAHGRLAVPLTASLARQQPPVKSSAVPLQGQLMFGSEVLVEGWVRGAWTAGRQRGSDMHGADQSGPRFVPLLRRVQEVGQSACLCCSLDSPCSACSSSRAVEGCAAVPEVLCGELQRSVCQRRRAALLDGAPRVGIRSAQAGSLPHRARGAVLATSLSQRGWHSLCHGLWRCIGCGRANFAAV
jgi:hypothetical protein